jgi:DNA replication protein DnaC
MGPEWLLPVAKEAYENRKDILSAWERISAWLAKKKGIAFTGMAGVGKTVLFDHLTGTAYKRGYILPLRSESLEKVSCLQRKSAFVFRFYPVRNLLRVLKDSTNSFRMIKRLMELFTLSQMVL